MNSTIRNIALGATALLFAGCAAGSGTRPTAAGSPAAVKTVATAAAPKVSYAGRYVGSGGGGAIPQVQALLNAFGHPEMAWQLSDVGSDAAVQLIGSNAVDLSFTSRDLKAEEVGKVQDIPIGAVATGIAVNAANPVKNLTKEQVRGIFSGQITDWSQVGGKPGKIKVFLREKVAATRANFETYFFIKGETTYTKEGIEVLEANEMLTSLRSFSGAIGMLTVDAPVLNDPSISLTAIDNVPVTKESILGGAYKVVRPLHLVYSSDPATMKPGIRDFIEFLKRPEGQKILATIGF